MFFDPLHLYEHGYLPAVLMLWDFSNGIFELLDLPLFIWVLDMFIMVCIIANILM